ncbi:MAG: phosphoribosylanthranilate isomerase [Synergistaceae bacterium]|nr:phosphoribosylanthranilate isomerase [Synergistaceae bacterium]
MVRVRIKFCGLTRICDIEAANDLMPEYVGFVFWHKSKRYLSPENAMTLRKSLRQEIVPVGVFVDENPRIVANMAEGGTIDMIQLHGHEDDEYIAGLRKLTRAKIIKAFRVKTADDALRAEESSADFVLLDSGMGTGKVFDWSLIRRVKRPYFLAGGLDAGSVGEAVSRLNPYAVDVSSGIETDGVKDRVKMSDFISSARG